MGMSRLVRIRLINFEAFEDATAEFDSRNILIIKGYNDSGKSAFVNSQRVLMYNSKKSEQLDMIKDDNEYFMILDYFDDGVVITYEKHRNGSSAYVMYKDGFEKENILFTTVQNGVMTQFDGVPEPIENYLAVGSYGDMALNIRDRTEKMLLTETSGGDNYKFLTTVLHTEELVQASMMLNADKNAKQSEISRNEILLSNDKNEYKSMYGINEELVLVLENLDRKIDLCEERKQKLESIVEKIEHLDSIVVIKPVEQISQDRVERVYNILDMLSELSEPIAPDMSFIESDRLGLICNISELLNEFKNLPDIYELPTVDYEKIEAMIELIDKVSLLKEVEESIRANECNITVARTELEDMSKTLEEVGAKFVKCNDCGSVIPIEENKLA